MDLGHDDRFGRGGGGAFVAFAIVERTAENPIVPFDLFFDRNRLATFAAIFLAGACCSRSPC
ncbi:efflux domain protein [Mycobacterium xenopi 3993]|nr:efflux domain protein [Mycobacterium xenopi 3993]